MSVENYQKETIMLIVVRMWIDNNDQVQVVLTLTQRSVKFTERC